MLRSASRALKPVPPEFAIPDSAEHLIGHYLDAPIYRKISIGTVDYYFDRIQGPSDETALNPSERYIKPGLVYASVEERVDESVTA